MKHSKWRCCDDFVKLSRSIKIFSISFYIAQIFCLFVFKRMLLIACSSSGVARRLVQNTATRKARPALDF